MICNFATLLCRTLHSFWCGGYPSPQPRLKISSEVVGNFLRHFEYGREAPSNIQNQLARLLLDWPLHSFETTMCCYNWVIVAWRLKSWKLGNIIMHHFLLNWYRNKLPNALYTSSILNNPNLFKKVGKFQQSKLLDQLWEMSEIPACWSCQNTEQVLADIKSNNTLAPDIRHKYSWSESVVSIFWKLSGLLQILHSPTFVTKEQGERFCDNVYFSLNPRKCIH